jgi:hypothetical protein
MYCEELNIEFKPFYPLKMVKFKYSENATKIWPIFYYFFDITKWKMGIIFAAFLEYLNFTVNNWSQNSILKGFHMPMSVGKQTQNQITNKNRLCKKLYRVHLL